MKIVFYHISDLHIEKEEDIKVINVHKMVDVLNGIGKFDAIVIIVSGDIACSGEREQYNAAYHMFGTIISQIKRKFSVGHIEFFVVPGNHDVDLTNDEGHKVIQEKIRHGVTSKMIEEELNKQINYLNYAKGIHCIDENDRLCCIKECIYDNKKIKFCLVNTATFSTLDEDKGLHFIPQNVMGKMDEKLDGDINITIMHHAHHWLNDSVKNNFENILIQKNNIVMCGHEHDIESSEIHKNGSKVIYLTGGKLCDRGDWSNSQFYLDIFDTTSMTLDSISYIWDQYKKIYIRQKNKIYSFFDMNPISRFELEKEFEESLRIDPINNISDNVFDYYVFPDLEFIKEYNNRESEILTLSDEFIKKVKSKKRIAIIGQESAGKTLLLKKIYLELSKEKYCCLYCDAISLRHVSFNKVLLTLFRNNYKDQNGSFDEFLQLPKEQKVIIVDNIHDIDKTQILIVLKWLEDFFGIIVYSTKELIELDVTERVKQTIELEDYCRYKILPMYMKKRQILISKIVNIKEDKSENNVEICNKISDSIKLQRKMYSMNPSYIIQFVDFYLMNFKDAFASDGNMFSKVFENNIINRIRPYARELTVDKILILLDEIAYWCFKKQKSEIGQENICKIITDYNKEHGDEVEYLQFVDACMQSKIIRRTELGGVKYRFVDKNVLSYFIARQIIRNWNDNLDDTDMVSLIKFIRYGINSNIILFVTYLTDNLYLIRNIIDSTIKYMENWSIFDPVNVNVPYLASLNGIIPLEAPTQSDREKNEEQEIQQDEEEINEYENSQIVVKDYFDSQVDDCEELINQIIRSITLLDIASKCMPGFEHRMRKEDKDKILNIIFNLPGKIFYIWANQIDKEKDDLLQYLLDEYRAVYLKPQEWDMIKKEDMMLYLQRESLSFLLDLLNIPINNAAKDYTIRYLSRYSNQNEVLYQVQMLMAYGKLDMVTDVDNYLKRIDPQFTKCIPDYMKRRVLRQFLITSNKISNDCLKRMISTYFPANKPNKDYRNILISRERNKKKQ